MQFGTFQFDYLAKCIWHVPIWLFS